jgi:SpoVK/Ycf46/Vps4 family AAA+-type ATPase
MEACGYLLYGPPGTGKSTMIAAMANYDIELMFVSTNMDLHFSRRCSSRPEASQ